MDSNTYWTNIYTNNISNHQIWRLSKCTYSEGVMIVLSSKLFCTRIITVAPPELCQDSDFRSKDIFWSVVSTHFKNISKIGAFPQVGAKIKEKWKHHQVLAVSSNNIKHLPINIPSPATPKRGLWVQGVLAKEVGIGELPQQCQWEN